MTEQSPMTTTDAPQPEQDTSPKVKIGEREMTLNEARATMHPALAHQIEQQFSRAGDTPELAQQFVETYAAEHERQQGQPWTGERQGGHVGTEVHEGAKSRTAHTERAQQREKHDRRP